MQHDLDGRGRRHWLDGILNNADRQEDDCEHRRKPDRGEASANRKARSPRSNPAVIDMILVMLLDEVGCQLPILSRVGAGARGSGAWLCVAPRAVNRRGPRLHLLAIRGTSYRFDLLDFEHSFTPLGKTIQPQ